MERLDYVYLYGLTYCPNLYTVLEGGTCINDWDCFCSDDLPEKNIYCQVMNNTLDGARWHIESLHMNSICYHYNSVQSHLNARNILRSNGLGTNSYNSGQSPKNNAKQSEDYSALIDDDGDYQNFYTNGINYDLTTEKTHIPGLESNQ